MGKPLHVSAWQSVTCNVKSFVSALVCLAAVSPCSGQTNLTSILKAVEDRYNRPRTMQLRFEQTVSGYGPGSRREAGDLYLRKPGKMRWDYTIPQGKFFLIDGKDVYFYSPNTGRVEKSPVRESDDMKAPLSFLIGRLDFLRYFREFHTRPEGENLLISASPKSSRAPYETVEFLVAPDSRIKTLKVLGRDGTRMQFSFNEERINPPLPDKLFSFQPLPGMEVVEISSPGNQPVQGSQER